MSRCRRGRRAIRSDRAGSQAHASAQGMRARGRHGPAASPPGAQQCKAYEHHIRQAGRSPMMARRQIAALLIGGVALFACGEEAVSSGTGTPPNFGPYSWIEGSKIGVLTDNPEAYPAIFVNSVNPDTTPPAGE